MDAKKVIAVLMILLAVTSVFAKTKKKKKSNTLEVGGVLTIGVPGFSRFAFTEDGSGNTIDYKPFGAFDLGFAALGHYSLDELVPNLGVQAEVRFASNAITGKMNLGAGSKEYTFKYVSLDVPIMATYKFEVGDFIIRPEGGFYLSFPLGKMKKPSIGGGDKSIDTAIALGLVLGVQGSYELGPGSILVDLRFINDFPKIKVDSEKFMTRRGFLLSAGYKIPLDF